MLFKNILTLKKKYIVYGLSLVVILLSALLFININNMEIIESNPTNNSVIENMECISNSYDNRNQKLDNKLCNASNSIEKRKDNLAK
tara:strand:- start:2372 stop:2632 length:261 start_codon:yes stop_codon:yes gene_type:complete